VCVSPLLGGMGAYVFVLVFDGTNAVRFGDFLGTAFFVSVLWCCCYFCKYVLC
jgi:hypothetical protein